MPGHVEKDPSWSIVDDPGSDKHGLHRCFGCKRGGSPAYLVSQVIGITEFSARDWLERNGCVAGEASPGSLPTKVRCEVAPTVNHAAGIMLPAGVVTDRTFGEWPSGPKRYLLGRGIGTWQVEAYGIGYAVHGEQEGRIVFPSKDCYGAIRYYTGRTFDGDRLRYLSCEEDAPGARIDAALFGEHLWDWRDEFDEVFTAEGAVKALAIERALCDVGTGERGRPVAAFSGSELHEAQVLKLRRFTRLTHVADPDDTGMRFARELEGKLCGAMGVRIVVPSDGKQADEVGLIELRKLLLGG